MQGTISTLWCRTMIIQGLNNHADTVTADQPSARVTCGFLDNKLNRCQNNVTSIQTILI